MSCVLDSFNRNFGEYLTYFFSGGGGGGDAVRAGGRREARGGPAIFAARR